MIAHLVRKYVPARVDRYLACPRCGHETHTESHVLIFCLACGQPIPLPPAAGRAA